MYIIGLTGGIGSGKTTVAKLFEKKGVPVYYADDSAKFLMQTDEKLIADITGLFGNEAYIDGRLNTSFIGEKVFSNPDLLKKLEAFVHPAVKLDFQKWVQLQDAPYVIMENAILHKSGMDKLVDAVILVQADKDIRIKRVAQRDKISASKIMNRISNQDNYEKLLKKSEYIINNSFSADLLGENINIIDTKVRKMLTKC